ncbi:MAG: NUDIX domain-containing protein [Anaerolineales bacterium]|nr:NUDIX domain-containing protein [Anaerolineales bacterium]
MEPYRFCPHCATELEPYEQGERVRKRCPSCQWVYYQNPTVGVAVILQTEEGLWLGRRRSGGWCIPCGHVEWDESIEQAAIREAEEEMGVKVESLELFTVMSNFHDPEHHTVGVWYRGRARDLDNLRAGGDLVELRPYPLDILPDLIFPTDREVVRRLKRAQK